MILTSVRIDYYWNQTKDHNHLGDKNDGKYFDVIIVAEYMKNGNTSYLEKLNNSDIVNFPPTSIVKIMY